VVFDFEEVGAAEMSVAVVLARPDARGVDPTFESGRQAALAVELDGAADVRARRHGSAA
jgi:hypothetical protein